MTRSARSQNRGSHQGQGASHVHPKTGQPRPRAPQPNRLPPPADTGRAARCVFCLTCSITDRDAADRRRSTPAVDSVWRDCPGGRRRARCPSMLRTSGPAAAGEIRPELARTPGYPLWALSRGRGRQSRLTGLRRDQLPDRFAAPRVSGWRGRVQRHLWPHPRTNMPYWANPGQTQRGAINHRDGGRGLYFEDPAVPPRATTTALR